jgi:hypothetical protein
MGEHDLTLLSAGIILRAILRLTQSRDDYEQAAFVFSTLAIDHPLPFWLSWHADLQI